MRRDRLQLHGRHDCRLAQAGGVLPGKTARARPARRPDSTQLQCGGHLRGSRIVRDNTLAGEWRRRRRRTELERLKGSTSDRSLDSSERPKAVG